MNKFIKIAIYSILLINKNFFAYNNMNGIYKVFKSASVFHVSLLYNSIKYGDSFTFNQVANDEFDQQCSEIKIESDNHGNIIKINDGKNTPLLIGSIPRKEYQLNKLNDLYKNLDSKKIGIYSLNLKFERDWAGLTKLLQNIEPIEFYKYPTVDFSSPDFIDLIRVVRDINNRDSKDHKLSYVHCKAGRGRSACAIIAYLMTLLHEAQIEKSVDQIFHYLQLKRPQVKLNTEHKVGLKFFKDQLNQAGTLDRLIAKHKNEIEKRDKQVLHHDI